MKDASLKDEYKIEAAPEDAEGEVVELRCGGTPHLFMTYDDLMKKVEVDPLLQAIVNDRVAQIAARWSGPMMGFTVGELIDLKADTRGYVRDPFFFQWQQHKLQAEKTAWKTPIYLDEDERDEEEDVLRYAMPEMFEIECQAEVVVGPVCKAEVVYTPEQLKQIYLDEKARHHAIYAQMAASEMDWEDDEEITQPGLAPAEPEYKLEVAAPTPAGGYPHVTTDGIGKTDRCYFCADQRSMLRFYRRASDSLISCVNCLYDHLRWELMPDGSLRRVPADT